MRLGIVQNNPAFGEVEANLDRVEQLLQRGRADVWVLPELFATGYTFASRDEARELSEPRTGSPTLERLRQWARQLDAAVTAGWAERDGDTLYNSASLITPDGEATHYRKLHLFADEGRWFAPGNEPLPVTGFRGARLGLMICFDWRFPEVARTLALRGADILLHPANLVHAQCPDAMLVRSLENRVFSATADRWGEEKRHGTELRFQGRSQIVDPDGRRLAQLPASADGATVVKIDLAHARNKHVTPTNDVFQDRRPDQYSI